MSTEINFQGFRLPFDPCPGTPNCHIDYIDIRLSSDKGLGLVHRTLKQMGARKVSIKKNTIDAEFRVFVFTDDFKVHVDATETGCRVWVRSSSRVGESDLGVNKRRVNKFFTQMRQAI
jgi:uncharacterized protein (DUF1499 family)